MPTVADMRGGGVLGKYGGNTVRAGLSSVVQEISYLHFVTSSQFVKDKGLNFGCSHIEPC